MKAAISIPDHVFQEAERLARAHGRSRSALYSDALRQYLLHHAPDAVTAAMNKVCATVAPQESNFVRSAARRMLRRETW